jgi:hypothetical protein
MSAWKSSLRFATEELYPIGQRVLGWILFCLDLGTLIFGVISHWHREWVFGGGLVLAFLIILAQFLRIRALKTELNAAKSALNAMPTWTVYVEQRPPLPSPLVGVSEYVESWLTRAQDRLLKPMEDDLEQRAREAEKKRREAEARKRLPGIAGLAGTVSLGDVGNLGQLLAGFSATGVTPEKRSEETFRAEVESYINAARVPCATKATDSFLRQRESKLHMQLRNGTSTNVRSVQLELFLPRSLQAFVRPQAVEMPDPPRKWGPHSFLTPIPYDYKRSFATLTPAWLPDPTEPAIQEEADGTSRIVFASVDLRPNAQVDLVSVSVLAAPGDANELSKIVARWRVTSTSHDSVREGHIALRLGEPRRIVFRPDEDD